MKKKLISTVLAGAMVLSLAACGTTGTTGTDTTAAPADNADAQTQEAAPADTAAQAQ